MKDNRKCNEQNDDLVMKDNKIFNEQKKTNTLPPTQYSKATTTEDSSPTTLNGESVLKSRNITKKRKVSIRNISLSTPPR